MPRQNTYDASPNPASATHGQACRVQRWPGHTVSAASETRNDTVSATSVAARSCFTVLAMAFHEACKRPEINASANADTRRCLALFKDDEEGEREHEGALRSSPSSQTHGSSLVSCAIASDFSSMSPRA